MPNTSHKPASPDQQPPHRDAAPSASDDDLRLLQSIQAGERSAWAALIARYQDRLFNVCLRMVSDRDAAADLTQDAFVKIIQGLATYDGRAALSTWLIRVTMNVCLSHIRAQKLRKHASLDASGAAPASRTATPAPDPRQAALRSGWGGGRGGGGAGELSPAEGVQLREDHARVAAALAQLAPEQRSILVLRDVQGLDYDQIAAALEVAEGTVKSRLFRARLALREILETGSSSSERQ